ncbi:MAG: hypothetical protein IPM36_17510 [Lewinellaceae bacterium]|nr:hypothetical protein [Lewinellaceae bacterium]
MKNLFGSLFSSGKPAANQPTVNSYEDLQVFENLNQQDEPLSWNDVPELDAAVKNSYAIRNPGDVRNPDEIRNIIQLAESAIAAHPDFDIPRLYKILGHLKLQEKETALTALKDGLVASNRKRLLLGGFSQFFYEYLLNRAASTEEFKILLATSTGAVLTRDNMFFGQLFLAEYLKQHEGHALQTPAGTAFMSAYYHQYHPALTDIGNAFQGDFLNTLQQFCLANPPDLGCYHIVSLLKHRYS